MTCKGYSDNELLSWAKKNRTQTAEVQSSNARISRRDPDGVWFQVTGNDSKGRIRETGAIDCPTEAPTGSPLIRMLSPGNIVEGATALAGEAARIISLPFREQPPAFELSEKIKVAMAEKAALERQIPAGTPVTKEPDLFQKLQEIASNPLIAGAAGAAAGALGGYALGGGFKKKPKKSRRSKKRSLKRYAKRSVKRSVKRHLKFGSPAWRKKYMKKGRKRRR